MSGSNFINEVKTSLGLAKYEIAVLGVILGGLVAGLIIKQFNNNEANELELLNTHIYNTLDSIAEAEKTTYIGTDLKGDVVEELKSADTVVKKEEFFPSAKKKEMPQVNAKINLNTASRVELMKLPGVGEATADKIIDYRNNSKFQSPEEIMKVKGIGIKKFEKMREFIEVR